MLTNKTERSWPFGSCALVERQTTANTLYNSMAKGFEQTNCTTVGLELKEGLSEEVICDLKKSE